MEQCVRSSASRRLALFTRRNAFARQTLERLTSHQGNVDWFCFWLKNEEDPARWRELRKLQDKGEGSSTDQ
jgi:hypothetical protein